MNRKLDSIGVKPKEERQVIINSNIEEKAMDNNGRRITVNYLLTEKIEKKGNVDPLGGK